MTTDAKRLGYGGSAEIDGKQVLITSGGFNTQVSGSYIEAYGIPPTTASRSRMKHADGTEAYSADLSLDVSDKFLEILTVTKLLGRRYKFNIGIHDGESGQVLNDCYVSSLSLQGVVGGLVSAQLSVVSAKEPASGTVANVFLRDDAPLGYWYSGNTAVRDWNFSFNQVVAPVYGNEDGKLPLYIKVGLVEYSLSCTTYESLQAHSVINISTKSFTLTGISSVKGYSFNGVTELGTYSHTFETAADATVGSGGVVIT